MADEPLFNSHEDVYGYVWGAWTDEPMGAYVQHSCGWEHVWPEWGNVPVADLLTVIAQHQESGCG